MQGSVEGMERDMCQPIPTVTLEQLSGGGQGVMGGKHVVFNKKQEHMSG